MWETKDKHIYVCPYCKSKEIDIDTELVFEG